MTENINKRSGRKRKHNYEVLEQNFQTAQTEWAKNENNLKAWQDMFGLIQLAVFNCINKKIEHCLDREEIEERSLDVTVSIMTSIRKKREDGKKWQIDKVSSFVYLPCRAIFSEKLQFNDSILNEETFSQKNDKGLLLLNEKENAYTENGILHLEGDYDSSEREYYTEKSLEIRKALDVAVERVVKEFKCGKDEVEKVILICSERGQTATNYMNSLQKKILSCLRGEDYKGKQQIFNFEDTKNLREFL